MPEHDFWLSDAQFARLQLLLPNKVRGDDRKVISGIIHVIRYGLEVARRARLLRTPQDTLQPLRALEEGPAVFRPHLPSPGCRKRRHQDGHGRQHPSGAHRSAASLLKKGGFRAALDAPGAG